MGTDDVLHVHQAAPETLLIASHMEAINHCVLTRATPGFRGGRGVLGQIANPRRRRNQYAMTAQETGGGAMRAIALSHGGYPMNV
jgi:hypothetical protein